jgi:hypothetical protein
VITEHSEYAALGQSTEERRSAFRSLFAGSLPQDVLDTIRTAANTDSALGSEAFMARAEALLGRSVRPPSRGRPPRKKSLPPNEQFVSGKLL